MKVFTCDKTFLSMDSIKFEYFIQVPEDFAFWELKSEDSVEFFWLHQDIEKPMDLAIIWVSRSFQAKNFLVRSPINLDNVEHSNIIPNKCVETLNNKAVLDGVITSCLWNPY